MTIDEIKLLGAKARAFRAEAFRHTGLTRLAYLRLAQAFVHLAQAEERIGAAEEDNASGHCPAEAWPRL